MNFRGLLQDLEATALATAIRESGWLFPILETIHVLALTLVVGTIALVDLRLIGFVGRAHPVTRLTTQLLPWTWAAFAFAVASGLLLFASSAETYFDNLAFQLKLGALALAGLNMAVFHRLAYADVHSWDTAHPSPRAARCAGLLSLVFWVAVVVLGRWIGFTLR